jgi:hypothetical protein
MVDLEAGMCAMQSRLWEEMRHKHEFKRHGSERDDIDDISPDHIGGYGHSWLHQLENWRKDADELLRKANTNTEFFSSVTQQETYFTAMMVYHMSYLRIYADITLIRRLCESFRGTGHPASLVRRLETRVYEWAKSTEARLAVYHASQMLQLYTREATTILQEDSLVNPVVVNCLFRAGVVVWAFCRSSLLCGLCSASTLLDDDKPALMAGTMVPVELTGLRQTSDGFAMWSNGGVKASIGGFLLCACNLTEVVEEFRTAIADNRTQWAYSNADIDVLADLKQRP